MFLTNKPKLKRVKGWLTPIYELTECFFYHGVNLSKKFVTDGFSIPWFLAWIRWCFFLPRSIRDLFNPIGDGVEEALIHDHECGECDALYEQACRENNRSLLRTWRIYREWADWNFWQRMKNNKRVSNRKAKKFYHAVRVGSNAMEQKALIKMTY